MAARTSQSREDQRARILDAALELMSSHGVAGSSMRQLATACEMNVATIYHYFPSKAELLQAVIAERRYGDRLADGVPPVDGSLGPGERFVTLFDWLWEQTLAEEQILRLLVGEGLRGEATARRSARVLVVAVDRWLSDVLGNAFPELADRGLTEASQLVRRQLLGLVAEQLVTGQADGHEAATELAAVLFGSDSP